MKNKELHHKRGSDDVKQGSSSETALEKILRTVREAKKVIYNYRPKRAK